MLLVLCVDLDDDVGRKTDHETPLVGREAVEAAAVSLAEADPEDSDVNVLFQGIHLYDEYVGTESVEVAAVTGMEGSDVAANRAVGDEVDAVLAQLSTDEDVQALLVTDGAQDESVVPVIRSRIEIDSVRRVVVRQSQDLESMYYTIKQVLNDPETRGTILVPLGILLLIYPLSIIANYFGQPGTALGVISGLLGLYVLGRGLGAERYVDDAVEQVRSALFSGRVTIVTSVVAAALLVIGGVSGAQSLETVAGDASVATVLAALVNGAVHWFALAGVTSSLGHVTDEYLNGTFEWRHLNAPFYVVAIAVVLHGVSAFFLFSAVDISYLALTLTGGTLLGVGSTLAFAIAETRTARVEPAA